MNSSLDVFVYQRRETIFVAKLSTLSYEKQVENSSAFHLFYFFIIYIKVLLGKLVNDFLKNELFGMMEYLSVGRKMAAFTEQIV